MISWMSEEGSSLSLSIPSMSVMEISASALSLPAILAAAVSALILYTLPSSSYPTVAITGIYPMLSTSRIGSSLICVMLPTNPSFSSSFSALIICESSPQRPSAFAPYLLIRFTRLLLILPASTIMAILAVSASVTLKPFTNSVFLPTAFSVSVISGPPPCTSTTFIPIRFKSTISLITAFFRSSFIIAFPPYLTTTILLLYCWM